MYVGKFFRSPEERLERHLSGGATAEDRSSRESFIDRAASSNGSDAWLPALYSVKDSKQAETEFAERLTDHGYVIEGGH